MIRKFCLTLTVIITTLFYTASAQQTAKITASGTGYLEYLPQGYNANSNKYPIVISLHGIGEKGTSSTDPAVIKKSLEKVDNAGLPKYVKAGQKYPFILISPQLKSKYGTWPPDYVMEVLNHVKKYLRIDERRIYLTGLSLGGFGVWKTAGEYPGVFAAIVPICPGGNALSKASAIAAQNVAIWDFHGSNDKIVSYTISTKMVNAVNSAPKRPKPLAKTTIFQGMGHGIWDKVYKQTNALNWMLSFRNGTTPSSPSETKPVAKAGSDKTLTLPANSLYIQGHGTDNDGSVTSYKWTKVSGGAASLSATTASKFRAYNLKAGTYVFRLTVKDNDGAVDSDDVRVTVRSNPTVNTRPVAHAGPDVRIKLPRGSIQLHGSGTDRDGKIISYQWKKLAGPAITIRNPKSPTPTITNLKKGHYYFSLTVKDNDNISHVDKMALQVSGG